MMIDRICGNRPLKDGVRTMLANRRMTHSILLVGEGGTGTGFAARCIAADYLYPQGGPMAEALLRGDCCKAAASSGKRDSGHIETGIVRDAVELRGSGSGGRVLVGQVIALRGEVYNSSLSSAGRVALLYQVQNMNQESANALLKVLEEPPEGVLFLLTASGLAGVLPTIRSRCVSFAVCPPTVEECAAFCADRGVPPKTAAVYSQVFDGRIGTVLRVAQSPQRQQQLEAAKALLQAAAKQDAYSAAAQLAFLEKDKPAALQLLEDGCALAAASLRQPELTGLSGPAAGRAIRGLQGAREQLLANGNAKLVLAVLAAKLCRG